MLSRLVSLLFIAPIVAALPGAALANGIEQRYAMRWNVEPIARLSMECKLYINAARCRIEEGPLKGRWVNGRSVGEVLGRTTWRIHLDRLAPGAYKVTYDLRTPTGAEWIPGMLRVPQIARNTGQIGMSLSAPQTWPQDRHQRIACDAGPVEFAWDRSNLYIRLADPAKGALEVSIDALPVTPGRQVKRVRVSGAATVPWNELFPAVPLTGQTLRYKVDGAAEWVDLLFVGTGLPIYFGATVVSHGPGGDDQGPPGPILQALIDLSGLDCRSGGVSWGGVERSDPGDGESIYDWSGMLSDADLYKDGLTYCHIELWNSWAEKLRKIEPERYRTLAERFVAEAARVYGSVGIRHFSLGFNEPEMFFRTDKEDYFNEDLSLLANAVRRGLPDAVVIAGKFSSGDPALIRKFYAHGFRDNFDVMDIHPYNNDPLTGESMGEIVASHETLEELGMGHKRLFLGEGWGPTRNLHQVVREKWDEPVSPEEADYTRQFYQNGYRCMVSARADYSPDWVLGAKYFTLNDNVGGTYWKQAAKPVRNDKGEVMYYLIGELRFDDPAGFKAFFCNGGLIDFFGNPKGQWFYDFPPAMPEVRVIATGAPDYVLEGEWHRIDVAVVNANPRPITGLTLGVRDRTGKFIGAISAEAVGEYKRESLAPGEVWKTAVRVRLDSGNLHKVRWAFEMQYKYDGQSHMSDDVAPVQVRMPIEVRAEPVRIVLDGSAERTATVTVRNNQRKPLSIEPASYDGSEFALRSSTARLDLAPGEEASFTVSVKPDRTEPGTKSVMILEGGAAHVSVVTPLACPRVTSQMKIDGDLADWPKSLVAAGGIRFGGSIGRHDRPAGTPFPEPPPVKASALEKSKAAGPDQGRQEAPAFGANAAAAWDEHNLYLAVMVEDRTFKQEFSGLDVWRQDSIQLAFDPLLDGAPHLLPWGGEPDSYGPDDYEMALALTSEGPQVTVITGPKGAPRGLIREAELGVRRDGSFTTYEARIPWRVLRGVTPGPGARFGFDILVNNFEDNDRYTLGWADGIGGGKYPGRFVPVVLR